jgi:hypothetical protein
MSNLHGGCGGVPPLSALHRVFRSPFAKRRTRDGAAETQSPPIRPSTLVRLYFLSCRTEHIQGRERLGGRWT